MSTGKGINLKIKKDGEVICSGIASKEIKFNGEPIDITSDDDDGWRALLESAGTQSIDIGFEGIAKDEVLRNIVINEERMMSGVSLVYPNGDTLSGNFFMSAYSEKGETNDAIKFSCELQSSTKPTFVAGSDGGGGADGNLLPHDMVYTAYGENDTIFPTSMYPLLEAGSSYIFVGHSDSFAASGDSYSGMDMRIGISSPWWGSMMMDNENADYLEVPFIIPDDWAGESFGYGFITNAVVYSFIGTGVYFISGVRDESNLLSSNIAMSKTEDLQKFIGFALATDLVAGATYRMEGVSLSLSSSDDTESVLQISLGYFVDNDPYADFVEGDIKLTIDNTNSNPFSGEVSVPSSWSGEIICISCTYNNLRYSFIVTGLFSV